MFEKKYRRKPRVTKAIQYDGTYEMAVDIAGEYKHMRFDGHFLYFTFYYEDELISRDDWLLVDNNYEVYEIVDADRFYEEYEEYEKT